MTGHIVRAAAIAVVAVGACASRGAPLTSDELVGDWRLGGADWALRLAADGTLANATAAQLDDPRAAGRWWLDGATLSLDFRRGGHCVGNEVGRYRVSRAVDGIRLNALDDRCARRFVYLDKEVARRVGTGRPPTAVATSPSLPRLSPIGGAGPIAAALVGEWRQPWPASASWLRFFANGRVTVGIGTTAVAQVDGLWRLDGDVLTFDNVEGLCSMPSHNRRARYRVAVDGDSLRFWVIGADGCRERRSIDREIWRRREAWWQRHDDEAAR